jgi:hypothetical protein
MGAGPSNAFPVFSSTTVPGASDLNRFAGNDAFFTVPPMGRFQRADDSLVGDNAWHACRFNLANYQADSQGSYFSTALQNTPGTFVDTFNINTTGVYHICATEHFTNSADGYHFLRIIRVAANVVMDQHDSDISINKYVTARLAFDYPLAAGEQVQLQHRAFSGSTLTLDPTLAFMSIRMVGRLTV